MEFFVSFLFVWIYCSKLVLNHFSFEMANEAMWMVADIMWGRKCACYLLIWLKVYDDMLLICCCLFVCWLWKCFIKITLIGVQKWISNEYRISGRISCLTCLFNWWIERQHTNCATSCDAQNISLANANQLKKVEVNCISLYFPFRLPHRSAHKSANFYCMPISETTSPFYMVFN